MKKLILSFMLLAGLPLAAASQVMPRIADDGVELYGTLYYSGAWDVGISKYDSAGIYTFPVGAQRNIAVKTPLISAGGITYHDGKVYCNVFDDEANISDEKPQWQIYDARTFELEKSVDMPANWEAITNSLAYDITSDKIYAAARSNFNDFYLARIEPETGEWENVGTIDIHWISSIACNRYGQLYAVASEGTDSGYFLARIDKSTGRIVKVGDITCDNLLDGDHLVVMNNKSALFFNNATGKLYWMLSSSSLYLGDMYTLLLEINISTGAASMAGYFTSNYVLSGLFLAEPLLSAPAGVSEFEFCPDGSNSMLSGKIKVTAPTASYGGGSLEGPLTVIIDNAGMELARISDVDPGAAVELPAVTLPYGYNTLSCRVVDADGREGTERRFRVFAGYDLPDYPRNVRLSARGLNLQLSWDAPEGGLNGLPVDAGNITYRIVKYPGETVLESDFKGNTYVCRADEQLRRYTFMVVARYNGNDGYATMSNYVIAGNPLDVPYQTDFAGAADFYDRYTVVDANGDGCTWNYDAMPDQLNVYYTYSETNSADDWMFTPPINMVAGKEYEIKITASSGYSEQLDHLELTFGDSCEASRHTVIKDIPAVAFEGGEYSATATPDKDGTGYFGIHACSLPFGGYLRIKSVSVAAKDQSVGIAGPQDKSQAEVRAGDGCIYIENPRRCMVYIVASDGRLVASADKDGFAVRVSPGLYVVKAGASVRKIVVR